MNAAGSGEGARTAGTGGAAGVGGTNIGSGGAAGSSPGAGTAGAVGSGGGAGTSGVGGTGGGAETCAGALTNCAGTKIGPWCVEQFLPGGASFPSFNDIWSDGPTDVWAVGAQGAGGFIFHWNGCTWTESLSSATVALNDVWGASPNDVWAVGSSGTALHWNGSAWSFVTTGATGPLNNVSGTSGDDIWAVGNTGAFHWNGTTWSASSGFPANPQNGFIGDVWAVAPNNVWATLGTNNRGHVVHFDGSTWTTTVVSPDVDFALFGIWSNGTTEWTVGEGNQIVEFAAAAWTQIQPPGGSAEGLLNVMAAGTDVYASGQSVVHSSAGGPFQADTSVPAGFYPGLWVTASQVWVAGQDTNGAVIAHLVRP